VGRPSRALIPKYTVPGAWPPCDRPCPGAWLR